MPPTPNFVKRIGPSNHPAAQSPAQYPNTTSTGCCITASFLFLSILFTNLLTVTPALKFWRYNRNLIKGTKQTDWERRNIYKIYLNFFDFVLDRKLVHSQPNYYDVFNSRFQCCICKAATIARVNLRSPRQLSLPRYASVEEPET